MPPTPHLSMFSRRSWRASTASTIASVMRWRFLYTPARTLAPGTRLAFVMDNPGGNEYYAPIPSVEDGNAYRVETFWIPRGGSNPLQIQVQRFYKQLGARLGDITAGK